MSDYHSRSTPSDSKDQFKHKRWGLSKLSIFRAKKRWAQILGRIFPLSRETINLWLLMIFAAAGHFSFIFQPFFESTTRSPNHLFYLMWVAPLLWILGIRQREPKLLIFGVPFVWLISFILFPLKEKLDLGYTLWLMGVLGVYLLTALRASTAQSNHYINPKVSVPVRLHESSSTLSRTPSALKRGLLRRSDHSRPKTLKTRTLKPSLSVRDVADIEISNRDVSKTTTTTSSLKSLVYLYWVISLPIMLCIGYGLTNLESVSSSSASQNSLNVNSKKNVERDSRSSPPVTSPTPDRARSRSYIIQQNKRAQSHSIFDKYSPNDLKLYAFTYIIALIIFTSILLISIPHQIDPLEREAMLTQRDQPTLQQPLWMWVMFFGLTSALLYNLIIA